MKYLKKFENNVSDNDVKYFTNYIKDYYTIPTGIMPLFTTKQIDDNIKEYITKRKKFGEWEDGDSFDREIFRDYLLVKLGIKKLNEVEYHWKMEKLLTPLEIDQIKYNL